MKPQLRQQQSFGDVVDDLKHWAPTKRLVCDVLAKLLQQGQETAFDVWPFS
jgi:hypothetical protein